MSGIADKTIKLADIFLNTRGIKRRKNEDGLSEEDNSHVEKAARTTGINDIFNIEELESISKLEPTVHESIMDECFDYLFGDKMNKLESISKDECSIKNDVYFTDLNKIIKEEPENPDDEKTKNAEIINIASKLKVIDKKSFLEKKLIGCEPNEIIYKIKLLALFRSIVYRTYDMSKNHFDVDDGFILYEDLFKVKIHITKSESADNIIDYFTALDSARSAGATAHNIHLQSMNMLEQKQKIIKHFLIHFGFPFYIFIKIDNLGNMTYFRKDFMNMLDNSKDIDSVLYSSSSSSYNNLDVMMSNNIIRYLINNVYKSGFDFLSTLIHIIQSFRHNNDKISINKQKIYFQDFYKIYRTISKNISAIPLK